MTKDELENYINGPKFREYQRDVILKEILDSDILGKAFETTEGKAILNNSVELITTSVIKIVSTCVTNEPKIAAEKVYAPAIEINAVYKVMQDWAKILIRGDEHKKAAERKN